jgi:osmotically-inducible protein OsmY
MAAAFSGSLMELPSRGQGDGAVSFLSADRNHRENSGGSHYPVIGRQVEIRIRGSSYLALRDVSCVVRGDILHLRGRVPSHYLKQVAQELAAGVEGVRQVENGIEVIARPVREGAGRRTESAPAVSSRS